jgi:hypothetical protein
MGQLSYPSGTRKNVSTPSVSVSGANSRLQLRIFNPSRSVWPGSACAPLAAKNEKLRGDSTLFLPVVSRFLVMLRFALANQE